MVILRRPLFRLSGFPLKWKLFALSLVIFFIPGISIIVYSAILEINETESRIVTLYMSRLQTISLEVADQFRSNLNTDPRNSMFVSRRPARDEQWKGGMRLFWSEGKELFLEALDSDGPRKTILTFRGAFLTEFMGGADAIPANALLIIYDADGNAVISSSLEDDFHVPARWKSFTISPGIEMTRRVQAGEREYLTAARQIPGLPLYALIASDTSEVMKPVAGKIRTSALLIVSFSIAAFLFASLLAGRYLASMTDLINFLNDIAEQKFRYRLNWKFRDERGQAKKRLRKIQTQLRRYHLMNVEELERAKKTAERADRAKSEFLANMSHEVRTPLHSILGLSDLIAETNVPQEARDYLERIQAAGAHLLTLINDVLDISRIESGRLDLEKIDFSPDDLFREVFGIIAPMAGKKGLLMKLEKGDCPQVLRGDPSRIKQIALNLLNNAVKFTAHGSVVLDYAFAPESETSGRFEMTVIDTGIGIPSQRISEIFQPFRQANSSTTREYGGTGLGLSIVQGLLTLMGGKIELKSEEKRGSRFYVTIPIEKGEALQKGSIVSGEGLCDMRILVAEDNADNRLLLEKFLKDTPVHLTFAENGREALNLFTPNSFDLILLDMQMPVLDGYGAAAEIRAREKESDSPPLPIVAMTADAFEENIRRCYDAGCTDHLAKPIRKNELRRHLARYCEKDPD